MPSLGAMVCMSNMNRSMEAHSIFSKKGFHVRSFRPGSMVRLQGPTRDCPVHYSFRAPYCYRRNGILHLLGRNEHIKPCPERFQDCREAFDVIFTCEESVYDRVVGHLCAREQETCQPVHVINVDMQDDLEDATLDRWSSVSCASASSRWMTWKLPGRAAPWVEQKTGRSFLHTSASTEGLSWTGFLGGQESVTGMLD
uniref:RNA polymerase II subunit A C-terminal domain phosphatase SSU72 n=1 Tax=Sus scrofa TaxID=9823 RepID=A0A4X1UD29_PIG